MNTHKLKSFSCIKQHQLIYSYSFTLLFSVRHKYRSTFVIFFWGGKEGKI